MSAENNHWRILYLSVHRPDRATGGIELRAQHILRALQQIGEVTIIVLQDESADNVPIAEPPDSNFTYAAKIKHLPKKRWHQKVQWALDPRTSYPHGCGVDAETTRAVLRRVSQFDLIWFCDLRTPNMFPNSLWPHSVVDINDVPSSFARATLQRDGNLAERMMTRGRVLSWKRREQKLGERFSVLAVCSQADKTYLESIGVEAPIHVIPNGFERPREEPVRNLAAPPRIGFTGVFDYSPNVEGIQWFVEKCWPRIKREVPDARLRLSGRFSDGPLKPSGPDVDGLGWVEDLDAEIATWSLMIVPILVGAGTRVKIALGFSRKCPVVSTGIGAHGYEITNGEEILLADSPKAFADACLGIIRQPTEADRMAERASRKFLERWTWDAIKPRIWAAAEECLRGNVDAAVVK